MVSPWLARQYAALPRDMHHRLAADQHLPHGSCGMYLSSHWVLLCMFWVQSALRVQGSAWPQPPMYQRLAMHQRVLPGRTFRIAAFGAALRMLAAQIPL